MPFGLTSHFLTLPTALPIEVPIFHSYKPSEDHSCESKIASNERSSLMGLRPSNVLITNRYESKSQGLPFMTLLLFVVLSSNMINRLDLISKGPHSFLNFCHCSSYNFFVNISIHKQFTNKNLHFFLHSLSDIH